MKTRYILLILVIIVTAFVVFTQKPTPKCVEGDLQTWPSTFNARCVNGEYIPEEKPEKEKAIIAKQKKYEYAIRLKERQAFCGVDNVDEMTRNLTCKDYSLVPDENLK